MWTTLLRKSFLEVSRLYDRFFALGEGGLEAVRRLGREVITFYLPAKTTKKKVRSLHPTFDVLETRTVPTASISASMRTDDPRNLGLVPIGETSVDANLGAVRISHPLDFDQSPGTGMGRSPDLVYNSATVNVKPIIQVLVTPDTGHGNVTGIDVQLTWASTAQSWISYGATGSTAPVVVAVQSTSQVTQTGRYDWNVGVKVHYTDGTSDGPIYSPSARASVVAQDSSVSGQVDSYAAGWGISGVDRLFTINVGSQEEGQLWVYGTGESEFFAKSGQTYTSPTGNFGTLTAGSII
jgi:hypothetical protein